MNQQNRKPSLEPVPSITSIKVLDRQTVIACLQDHLDDIRAFNVRSMFLFGSVARNEATPNSDLDFLVEFEGAATLDGYMDLKYFLEDLFGCSIDLITRKTLKPIIRQSVLEKAMGVTGRALQGKKELKRFTVGT